jgi:hypothetical protein
MMPEAHSSYRFPNRMALTQEALMLADIPSLKQNLGPRGPHRLL